MVEWIKSFAVRLASYASQERIRIYVMDTQAEHLFMEALKLSTNVREDLAPDGEHRAERSRR